MLANNYKHLRPLLFTFDAEKVHTWTLGIIHTFPYLVPLYQHETPVQVMGISFCNRLGLAAGLDKDGIAIHAFDRMGFGFIEVGTVTPKAQSGNPKPRLFRLPQAQAIINRMGFNNDGVDNLCKNVDAIRKQIKAIIGINIGKNKATDNSNALADYLYCMDKAYVHADYLAVNISSPNTLDLRDLQHGNALETLLTGIKKRQKELAEKYGKYVPVVVKIAPDNTPEELAEMLDIIDKTQIDGIIATNTTIDKTIVSKLELGNEIGGLSGAPLTLKSTECIKIIRQRLPNIALIATGGIMTAEDYQAKLAAGADLVQLYTGFIYKGPLLIKECLESHG